MQSTPAVAGMRVEKFVGARTSTQRDLIQILLTHKGCVSEPIVAHAFQRLFTTVKIQFEAHVSQTTEIEEHELSKRSVARGTRTTRYPMPGLDSVDESFVRHWDPRKRMGIKFDPDDRPSNITT
jgi:hypothetical protein